MKKIIFVILSILTIATSCEKNTNSQKGNAEIISFNPDKCSCCWGWTIIIENDTIKADNVIIGETVGYDIINPISVYLELGEKIKICSTSAFTNPEYLRDYYEIKKIEIIEK